jgi:hypothetical protein
MSSAIPWPETAPDSKEAIFELLRIFEETPEIVVAWHTIVGDLLQSKLTFAKSGEPAPIGYDTFCADAVKAIMVTGCFFWKIVRGTLKVAHPLEMWFDNKERGWHPVVVYPPRTKKVTEVLKETHGIMAAFTSPVHTVRDVANQLNHHRKLFLDRDILNSRPACFVSISERLQNNGHPKPWFRSVQADYVDNFEEDLNQGGDDVERLISDRAAVISKLGSSTQSIRKKRKLNEDSPHVLQDSEHKEHNELIVTDGYEAKEAKSLQSLSDNLNFVASLKNQLFQMLKVPPAAIGANINTERLASSSQLVARSMIGYHAYVDQLRKVLSKVFEEAEDEDYVFFKRTLTAFELQQVAPYLKESKNLESTSLAYNVPKEWFDIKKFKAPPTEATKAMMPAAGHHPEQNEINKEKRKTNPPPKSNATV